MWGVRGGREYPPLTHIQSNACWFLFLLFAYLRFAEAASFDKKSYAGAIHASNKKSEFGSASGSESGNKLNSNPHQGDADPQHCGKPTITVFINV
jgi:hypothetical protein